MYLALVGLCLLAIIGLYFYNNPLKHSSWFVLRRFINWFPLGMTYAFLYMGRYNLNVSKNALGTLMTKEALGTISAVGTAVYGISFVVNGPLVDKIGGKLGIIIAALGASMANIVLGVLTYLVVAGHLHVNLVLAFSVLYAINMYFQSFGAGSIIKVKAYWFHVRERGVFSAIFGTLISFGVYFAWDWGQGIVEMAQANFQGGATWMHRLIRYVFAAPGSTLDATWAVFYIPAAILLFWVVLDVWLIKDTPEEANLPHLDTHDASSGVMHIELSTMDLLKKVFASRLMLLIAFIGLATGVLRNGVMNWYPIFANEVKQPGMKDFCSEHWGLLLCVFGIIGGFSGMLSDKLYQSRRGPPVVICCGLMLVLTAVMALFLSSSLAVVGAACVLITMAAIGVHSLMSGTAAADFGGRKATATCAGIVDGFVYLGSSMQSYGVGHLASRSWMWWPIFLMPFALLGGWLALKIWHELPAATRKYIQEVEDKGTVEILAK